MASKWAGLKGKLPAFEQPKEWQVKIDEVKKSYVELSPVELIQGYDLQRDVKRKLEERVKFQNTMLEALSQLGVVELEATDTQKLTTSKGLIGYIGSEPYSTVSDRELWLKYIRASKQTSLLTVMWQTQNAIVKECLMAGKPVPPGLTVYYKTALHVRGGNSGEE